MESIREIFKIGKGPSSSHTMAPRRAAQIFKERHQDASLFKVTLYGSLAATGKGHLTDEAVIEVLGAERCEVIWHPDIFLPEHPNGIKFEALDNSGKAIDSWTTFSIGGGDLSDTGKRGRLRVFILIQRWRIYLSGAKIMEEHSGSMLSFTKRVIYGIISKRCGR